MEAGKKALCAVFERYCEAELANMKKCHQNDEKLENFYAKLILSQIRMNSAKRIHIFQILIGMVQNASLEPELDDPRETFRFMANIRCLLQEHIKLEKEMVMDCEQIIPQINEPDIKLMFQFLVEEEKMHELLLNKIINQLNRMAPITISEFQGSSTENNIDNHPVNSSLTYV